ncbi:MAG TPA: 3-hydroxyisobutyrate dehydrogenase [Dongiaceae bacterium]|jgi:3-hydroxyisobutyrate dehydrogenase
MAAIGFIGLGNMGAPMARNLLKAGHGLRVFDLAANAVAELTGAGAQAAASAGDAAKGAEIVITMLPAGQHSRAVYLGEAGLIAQAQKGDLLIDCSTIDVATSRDIHAAAAKGGISCLDAPVSGGVAGAAGATLTFMVGGSAEAFARAEPILRTMGKAAIHAGGPGNGQAAKICNNMILGISMIAVSEAFVLAEKLGLSDATLFEVASRASGQCWSLTSYCPVPGPVPESPANNGYRPGFTAAMMLKDLKLAEDAAKTSGAGTPLGNAATDLYERFVATGKAGTDFSGIIEWLRTAA